MKIIQADIERRKGDRHNDLVFEARGGTLVIRIVHGNGLWCHCYLRQKEMAFLGAEKLSYLAPRLVDSLSAMRIARPRRVASLSEPHNVVFVLADQAWRFLLFQDTTALFFACLPLTLDECRQWKEDLRAICSKYEIREL